MFDLNLLAAAYFVRFRRYSMLLKFVALLNCFTQIAPPHYHVIKNSTKSLSQVKICSDCQI